MGKSRLLLEFDSWLAESPQRVYWFRGRAAHTGQNRANGLLRDLVSSRLAIADSDSAEVARGKLEDGFVAAWAVTDDDPEDARRAARLVGSWLSFDVDDPGSPEDGTHRDPMMLRNAATEALAGYLARLSTRNPVVVLLEDLHWADDGSLRWLDAAHAFLADAQVLVVATTRPSLFEERPRWGEGLEHHVRLPLDTLSRRESRLLLQQLLQHVEDPPAELLELVIGSAEGNPFYIEELVTWLIDAGVIIKDQPALARRTRPGRLGAGAFHVARCPAGTARRALHRGAGSAAARIGRRPGVLGRGGRQPGGVRGRRRRRPHARRAPKPGARLRARGLVVRLRARVPLQARPASRRRLRRGASQAPAALPRTRGLLALRDQCAQRPAGRVRRADRRALRPCRGPSVRRVVPARRPAGAVRLRPR